MMISFLQWLEDSTLAVAVRQSSWLYPGLEIVHISGIVLLVGPAVMFDLRLLGFGQKLSIPMLASYLLPWSRRGLVVAIASGLFLFITNATTLAIDPVFWTKMLLLIIAGLNALFFHRFTLPVIASGASFLNQRVAALVSILAWIAIISCGRLLAY